MRTTVELEDELLEAARQLARQRGLTLGQVISSLARKSLEAEAPQKLRNGFPLFPLRAATSRPDLSLVNRLRDEP